MKIRKGRGRRSKQSRRRNFLDLKNFFKIGAPVTDAKSPDQLGQNKDDYLLERLVLGYRQSGKQDIDRYMFNQGSFTLHTDLCLRPAFPSKN